MKRLNVFLSASITISFLSVFHCMAQITNTLPNGTKYVGEMKNGEPNGRGTLTVSGGLKYVGEFRNGKAIGEGMLIWTDGAKYVGGFRKGKYDGYGTYTSTNATYVGDFRNGKYDGLGTFTFSEGTWIGKFKDGKPYRVRGTCLSRDGTTEVGTWNYDGTKCGGTITWKDGRKYTGDWKVIDDAVDLPDGIGTMSWPSGRQYVGQFRDGKMDGTGKMTYPDGKVEEGLWKADKFVGASSSP
jgi:hypothetical protein